MPLLAVVAKILLEFEFYTQVKNDCEKGAQQVLERGSALGVAPQ